MDLLALRAGDKLKSGLGESEVIPTFDFETYSPAGFVWDIQKQAWKAPHGAGSKGKGLGVVGTANYTLHPEADILSLAYDLKDGRGVQIWTPLHDHPHDLLMHVQQGGLLEAWNVAFEYYVWTNICIRRFGWPALSHSQLRCAMAKARAFCLPGALDNSCLVLKTKHQKNPKGKRLLTKYSVPRNPTKTDGRLRNFITNDLNEAAELFQYNADDVNAESECSHLTPDLIPFELEFWQFDQLINRRGVQIDLPVVRNCIKIIEETQDHYNQRLNELTQGEVTTATQLPSLKQWLTLKGLRINTLDDEDLAFYLSTELPPEVREVLEIRQRLGSASVKKLYAMVNTATPEGRLHELFIYHSARTGRAAGAGVQPQNLPKTAISHVKQCECNEHYKKELSRCPYCNSANFKIVEWNINAVENAIRFINAGSLEQLEYVFGNPTDTIISCIRSLFIAKPQHDLICSDFNAIEAVVLAQLAGEQWRLDVFNTHGKIYEMSASKITGIPFEEFEAYKQRTGQHHPKRNEIGKVAELASGYQGWTGAWKQFGADKFFTEDEMKSAILAWRRASPMIVEFWGGQVKNNVPHYFGVEGMAILAIMNPGQIYSYRNISFQVYEDILYCGLPSGRKLVYHKPRLEEANRFNTKYQITFETWNSNPKGGGIGWIRIATWGGRLTENIVQAVARDILANSIINLEKSGYPVVLHVHDEIVSEVPVGFGSLEEFENIMSTMPVWAIDWPIKAKEGWCGNRYRK